MTNTEPVEFNEEDLEYDREAERYHLPIDPDQQPKPSLLVVYLISHITDQPPLSLPPVYSAVDTDLLANWLDSTKKSEGSSEIMFTYTGFQVTMNSAGDLWVQQVDEPNQDSDEGSRDDR